MTDTSIITNAALRSLLETFGHEIIDCNGLLLLSTHQVQGWQLDPATIDTVDVEATMNKRYVSELVDGLVDNSAREELMVCGRLIIEVWADRIAARFPGRHVVFYLGGSESVIVRFHLRHADTADWIDLDDWEFIVRSRLEVYELKDQRLRKRLSE